MAWGARSNLGIDDLVARVASDESNLTALALLPSRRFGAAESAALAGALRANTRIAELHLGGRAMSAESASLLAEALIERSSREVAPTATTGASSSSAASLRALSVGDASFGCAGAAALAPLLSHAGALCGELDLEFRGIGLEGARALSEAVVEARKRSSKAGGGGTAPLFLQSLNLARNPSLGGGDGAACEALSAALFDGVEAEREGGGGAGGTGAVLTSLDLSGCALSSAGVAALVRDDAASSASPPPSRSPSPSPLLSLRLERNEALDDLAAAALARALAPPGRGGGGGLANLRHLSLSGCPLVGDAAAGALSAALSAAAAAAAAPAPCALRSLDLSGCGVGPLGAEHLAAALRSAGCRLRKLRLSGGGGGGGGGGEGAPAAAPAAAPAPARTIGDEGALSLARALAEASPSSSFRLADLDLSSCGLSRGEAAAALLSPSVEEGLEALTLAGNPLCDAGAVAVAAALLLRRKSKDRLQHLDLAACGIGLEGAAALAEALLTTTAETEGGDGKQEEGKSEFAAPSLRTLVLGGNPATEDDAFAERVVARLREARPELDVAWRSGDQHAAAAEKK